MRGMFEVEENDMRTRQPRPAVRSAQHFQSFDAVRGAKYGIGDLQLLEGKVDRHDIHLIILDE
jgi:hypothetical protein